MKLAQRHRHPERSEGSLREILRVAQNDTPAWPHPQVYQGRVFRCRQDRAKSQHPRYRCFSLSHLSISHLYLCLYLVFLVPACTSSPQETNKSLVKINNVTLSRLDKRTLRVTMNYDLEMGVKLPLPYKSVLVFPLEPRGKLAGQVPEIEFSNGLIALDLEVPSDAGFDWTDLEAKDACCVVSLKGVKDVLGSNVPQYDRISNSVTVPLPPLAG